MESITELKRICQKGSNEQFLYFKYLIRPISIYFTKLVLLFRISANTITYFGIFIVLSGSFLLTFDDKYIRMIAGIMLFFFTLLDGVDGEVARYHRYKGVKSNEYLGKYHDAFAHMVSYNIALFSLGLGIYLITGQLLYLILGYVACMARTRLPHIASYNVIVESLSEVGIAKEKLVNAFVRSEKQVILLKQLTIEIFIWPFPMGLILPVILILEYFLGTYSISRIFLISYTLVAVLVTFRTWYKQISFFNRLR